MTIIYSHRKNEDTFPLRSSYTNRPHALFLFDLSICLTIHHDPVNIWLDQSNLKSSASAAVIKVTTIILIQGQK
jgi:low affinity Fe/Cu permease